MKRLINRPSGDLVNKLRPQSRRRKLLARRPSAAMAVALVALSSSLVGGAAAATLITGAGIKNGSITNKDLKKNSVRSKQVKNGSLLSKDFKPGQLVASAPGAQGPQGVPGAKGDPGSDGTNGVDGLKGDKGDTGAAGSALAFARVASTGLVDVAKSKNVAQVNVTREDVGVYCISGLNPAPLNAVATPQFFRRTLNLFMGEFGGCPPGTQVSVLTFRDGEAAPDPPADSPFTILFN